jgi:hypothetical protein
MRKLRIIPLLALSGFLLLVSLPSSVQAEWITDGDSLCTATGFQWLPAIATDEAGGAIVTWMDNRPGNYEIFAQRVNATGAIQWTVNGVVVVNGSSAQQYPEIVSDGGGGAIVLWEDDRGGNQDLYAQRVSAGGAIQWATYGVAICAAT